MTTTMTKEELKIVIDQLAELGEDRQELAYWYDIYEDLPEQARHELADNLADELEKLKEIDKRFSSQPQ